MKNDINDEDIFAEGYWIEEQSGEDFGESGNNEEFEGGFVYEYKPRFPVDMEHPAVLTDEQREHARLLLEAIDKYFEENPDDGGVAPLLRITQNWEVKITRGGYMHDTDFVDPILCVMSHGEEGFYIDPLFVEQCVPFIEEDLKACGEMWGTEPKDVPTMHAQELKRITQIELDMLALLAELDENYGYDRILIAIDTVIPEVYAWPIEEKAEEYGGLIRYFRADTLISADGQIDVDRVKKIVREVMEAE